MSDERINAFVGGVIGGFAAVGMTTVAMQILQYHQQQAQQEQLQDALGGMFGGSQEGWS